MTATSCMYGALLWELSVQHLYTTKPQHMAEDQQIALHLLSNASLRGLLYCTVYLLQRGSRSEDEEGAGSAQQLIKVTNTL